MIELRQYQKDAIKALMKFYREDENGAGVPLIVCPTGAGKSLVIADICRRIVEERPHYKTLILSHRKEIIQQNAKKLQELLPLQPIGIYSAGLGEKRLRNITFANIQSIARIASKLDEHQVLIIDEVHLVPNRIDSQYQKVIAELRRKNPCLKILGLTATPYRLDQGSLLSEGSLFTDICYDISIRRLIDEGFLSHLVSKVARSAVDMTGVRSLGYDFAQDEMEAKFDAVVREHCREIAEKGADRKSWLIFCSGIKHAADMSECLNAMGIPTDYVHSEMLGMDRDRRINSYKAGQIRAICNCQILTTGFDDPKTDLLVLARATKSTSLYVQCVGRAMRTATGKEDALILDFGGNIERHGPVDAITVKAKRGSKKAEIKSAPCKTCPECGEVVPIQLRECTCGYEYPANTTKLEFKPSTAPILSEPEVLDVTWWNTKIHRKMGKPPSFKIEYGSGTRIFMDYLCFEHSGFAREMAWKKWRKLGGLAPAPTSVAEATERAVELPTPATIKVIKDGQYWRVISVEPRPYFDSEKELGINI